MEVHIYACAACQWKCAFMQPQNGGAKAVHDQAKPDCPKDQPVVYLMKVHLVP